MKSYWNTATLQTNINMTAKCIYQVLPQKSNSERQPACAQAPQMIAPGGLALHLKTLHAPQHAFRCVVAGAAKARDFRSPLVTERLGAGRWTSTV